MLIKNISTINLNNNKYNIIYIFEIIYISLIKNIELFLYYLLFKWYDKFCNRFLYIISIIKLSNLFKNKIT